MNEKDWEKKRMPFPGEVETYPPMTRWQVAACAVFLLLAAAIVVWASV